MAGPWCRSAATSGRRGLILLSLTIVAEIAFLVAIPRFVTVDGATHVGSAAVIRDVLQGAGAVHLRYLDFTAFPAPNILPAIGLALATLVLEPAASEKLLQIAYVILMPLALLYALRSVRAGRDWLAILAVPLTFTFAFQYGFYDFSVGVGLFLVAAGFLWRHRTAPGWRAATVFGTLAFLLYLTHVVPFLNLLVFGGVVATWRATSALIAGGPRAAAGVVAKMLPLAISTLPSVVLAAAFFLTTDSAVPDKYLALPLQIIGVLGLGLGLVTTDRLEILVAVGLAVTLLVMFVDALGRRLRESPRATSDEDALLVYAVVAVLIACLAPGSVASGGSYIPERLALFPVYGLALWLAAAGLRPWAARLGGLVWLTAAAALLVVRLPTTVRLSDAAVEYEAVAPCIALQSTMIQVNLARLSAGSLARTDPFTSETGRIAAVTRGHDLGSFEGTFPFFLFRNKPVNDPTRWLLTRPDGFGVPPGVDLARYLARPDGTVDYVLVVGRPMASPETLADSGSVLLRDQLAHGYRLVARSASGLLEAWERMSTSLATAGDARRRIAGSSACLQAAAP